jgi:hypothetical protein
VCGYITYDLIAIRNRTRLHPFMYYDDIIIIIIVQLRSIIILLLLIIIVLSRSPIAPDAAAAPVT